MKKFFEEPIVEITKFQSEDILTDSFEQDENELPISPAN